MFFTWVKSFGRHLYVCPICGEEDQVPKRLLDDECCMECAMRIEEEAEEAQFALGVESSRMDMEGSGL